MRDEARPREHARSRSEEDRESYHDIFFEPPYSIRQAAAGLIVMGICRLLYLWIRGD